MGPNNLHLLFIPLFTGYGLAFLSVLWNRINLPMHHPIVRNGHFILAILLSSFPFMMNLVIGIRQSTNRPKEANCHWPYYVPQALASLHNALDEKEVIVTDIPWATAWYADRVSVWLPKNKKQFYELMKYSRDKNEEIVGLLFTPTSLNQPFMSNIIGGENEDWQEVILRLPVSNRSGGLADTMAHEPDFPFKQPNWLGVGTIFYTDQEHFARFAEDYKKARAD